jgi:hypothetical protein
MTARWRVRRWAEMTTGERTQLLDRSLAACSIRALAGMREGGLALARHEGFLRTPQVSRHVGSRRRP